MKAVEDAMDAELRSAMDEMACDIDNGFDQLLPVPDDARARLVEAMRYAAIGGGKRLRPLLLCSSAALFNVDRDIAINCALAIESIHVYSLIHDDLPAMDDDDMRRGKPTVHRAYDEATAILAGDALHVLAFDILTRDGSHPEPHIRAELVACLARASSHEGMAGGQMMDMAAQHENFELSGITRLQQLKTGALITAAVEMGAILGGVPETARAHLRNYAHDLGLAFQITDDLLDVEGQQAVTGKAVGKDERAGKATFVSLMGVERAREQAQFLVQQAIDHLQEYGTEANMLRHLARYTLARDR